MGEVFDPSGFQDEKGRDTNTGITPKDSQLTLATVISRKMKPRFFSRAKVGARKCYLN